MGQGRPAIKSPDYGAADAKGALESPVHRALLRSRGTSCPGSHRQSEPETTALVHLTLDPHLATMSLDQVPGDGQPQPRAAS